MHSRSRQLAAEGAAQAPWHNDCRRVDIEKRHSPDHLEVRKGTEGELEHCSERGSTDQFLTREGRIDPKDPLVDKLQDSINVMSVVSGCPCAQPPVHPLCLGRPALTDLVNQVLEALEWRQRLISWYEHV
jgi:hypothetical protein